MTPIFPGVIEKSRGYHPHVTLPIHEAINTDPFPFLTEERNEMKRSLIITDLNENLICDLVKQIQTGSGTCKVITRTWEIVREPSLAKNI